MCILFSFKHSQTFPDPRIILFNIFRPISNMNNYPLNPQLWWKHKLKFMIRNKKIKSFFICWPSFFKWMGVFQSCLDLFSFGVWAFIQNINFFIFSRLCMLVSICYNFKMLAAPLQFFSNTSNCIRYCLYSLQKTFHMCWRLIQRY